MMWKQFPIKKKVNTSQAVNLQQLCMRDILKSPKNCCLSICKHRSKKCSIYVLKWSLTVILIFQS